MIKGEIEKDQNLVKIKKQLEIIEKIEIKR